MDENTHLPEGIFRDSDESILKPVINTTGSSATPVNEPVIPETLQVAQNLWPDADSVTPAPVSASSKPDVPAVAAPLSTPPDTLPSTPPNIPGTPLGSPLSTPPEHVSATSLIGSLPIEPQPVPPALDFTGQSAPDPRTRVATFTKGDSAPASESQTGVEPTATYGSGSTTEYPPLKMIDADAVAPAMGARLSAYQKSTTADEVSSSIPATPYVSATPTAAAAPAAPATPAAAAAPITPAVSSIPTVSNIPVTPATPAAPAAPTAATIPSAMATVGAPSASGEVSATQVEPIRLEVRTKVVEPTAYNEPTAQSASAASAASSAPIAPTAPAAPTAYGESNEPVGQVTLNFGDRTPIAQQASRVNSATAEEPMARARTAAEQPAIIPAPQAIPEESPVAEPIEEAAVAAVEQITREQLAVASADQLAPEAERPEPVYGEPIEVEEEPVEKGISVITREATVLGDILTEGHIDIVGRVKGNIDAKGDVAIHGIVRGDVDGSKIGLYSCRVKGNLNAGLGVIVDDNSIIGGDVRTKNIIFDGKVKGNIDADNVVVLRSHSYCLGDVSAASLAVEPGAILNGKVRTFVDGDLEAPFDEVM